MERGKEAFVLKINIKSIVDFIRVFENDEPYNLAQEFIKKHHLSSKSLKIIEKEIELNIDRIMNSTSLAINSEEYEGEERNNSKLLANDSISKLKTTESMNESISKLKTTASLKTSIFSGSKHLFSRDEYISSVKSLSPNKRRNYIDRVKLYRFQTAFRYLNPDKNGKITCKQIAKLKLSERLYKILMPIIDDIKARNLKLGYREFCAEMEILLDCLSSEDKYYILSPHVHVPLYVLPNRHRIYSPRLLPE